MRTILRGLAAAAAPRRIHYIFVAGSSLRAQAVGPFLGEPRPRSAGGVLWASDHVGVLVQIARAGPVTAAAVH